jgi:hypothetical protein
LSRRFIHFPRAAIRLPLVELTSTQPFRSFFTVAAVAASHWLDAHKLHANGKKGLVQIALRTPPNPPTMRNASGIQAAFQTEKASHHAVHVRVFRHFQERP